MTDFNFFEEKYVKWVQEVSCQEFGGSVSRFLSAARDEGWLV